MEFVPSVPLRVCNDKESYAYSKLQLLQTNFFLNEHKLHIGVNRATMSTVYA